MGAKEDPRGMLPIDAWDVDGIRLTIFTPPNAQVDASEWWQGVTGSEPETVTKSPRVLKEQYTGLFDKGKLTLTIVPGRLDWSFATDTRVSATVETTADGLYSIGSFSSAMDTFMCRISKWFKRPDCPLAVRLAFGVVLYHVVDDQVSGTRLLLKYLPYIHLEPEAVLSFLYQVNRPYIETDDEATKPELSINCLSNWAVAMVYPKVFSASPEQTQEALEAALRLACRVELDINTDENSKEELSPKEVLELFKKLTKIGVKILKDGDG